MISTIVMMMYPAIKIAKTSITRAGKKLWLAIEVDTAVKRKHPIAKAKQNVNMILRVESVLAWGVMLCV